jgi:hypothetical protein
MKERMEVGWNWDGRIWLELGKLEGSLEGKQKGRLEGSLEGRLEGRLEKRLGGGLEDGLGGVRRSCDSEKS